MKTTFALFSAVAVVAWAPMEGTAQPITPNGQPAPRADALSSQYHLGKMERADKIIGMEIKDARNQRLGTVSDLAVDLQNGRVVEVIVGSGGIFGVDERLTAVPPGQFTCDPDRKELQLNVDGTRLKEAPAVKYSNWEAGTTAAEINGVYQYYGAQPYVADQSSVNNNGQAPANAGAVNGGPAHGAQLLNSNTSAAYVVNGALVPGEILRASKVIGATVQNRQDQRIGDVKDLMVDLRGGRVVEAVVASGGFLGLGDELSAVPPQSFQKQPGSDTFVLDTTKEALASRPHFTSSEWDAANSPDHVVAVYNAYNVPPFWSGDAMTQNNRQPGLTPLQQGTSPADMETTRNIRRQIEAASGLSIGARNVQIITIDGRVTLRGMVKSQDEKRRIGDIAARVVSAANVVNQLQVQEFSSTGSVN